MNLGALIDALKACDQKADVYIDRSPVYLSPTTVTSYRGIYAELAIGVECTKYGRPVGEVASMLEAAVGATFEGYKGGSYKMDRSTHVWIANWGEAGDSEVTGVRIVCGSVYLTWSSDDATPGAVLSDRDRALVGERLDEIRKIIDRG